MSQQENIATPPIALALFILQSRRQMAHVICQYLSEHSSFTPRYDAFPKRKDRRFNKLFDDAWGQKSVKKLWFNPRFHVFQDHAITQAG